MQSHPIELPTYFTYYDIDPALYKPKQNLFPLLFNKKVTEQGELILATLFQGCDDKEALLALAGSGRLYYSLFKQTAKPDSAQVLHPFSRAQLDQFKWDYYKISSSLSFKKIGQALMDLASHLLHNPLALFTLFLNFSLIVAAFHTKASSASAQQSMALETSLLSDTELSFSPSLAKQINFLMVQNSINAKKQHNKYVSRPVFFNKDELEYYMKEAIISDDLVNFKYALSRDYDLFKTNKVGVYTLLLAAKTNSVAILNYVTQVLKIDLNQFQSTFEDSWILNALDYDHFDLAKQLLLWGVDIHHLFENKKYNLLHLFAISGHDNQFAAKRFTSIEKLLALGMDINSKSFDGLPAVFIASMYNDTDMMGFLLDKGCETILHTSECLLSFSMLQSSQNTLEFLLKRGFDPNFYGLAPLAETAEDVVEFYCPIGAAIKRGEIAYIKLLFDYGLRTEAFYGISNPLFCEAFIMKKPDIAQYLVDNGVEVEEFAKGWKILFKKMGKKVSNYEVEIESFLKRNDSTNKDRKEIKQKIYFLGVCLIVIRIAISVLEKLKAKLITSIVAEVKLHNQLKEELRIKEKSARKKNKAPINTHETVMIQKNSPEYRLIQQLKKTLVTVNDSIALSKTVRLEIVELDTCVMLFDKATAWENEYKALTLERGCEGLQKKYNETVKQLQVGALALKKVLAKNTKSFKEEEFQLLEETQTALQVYVKELEGGIKDISTQKTTTFTKVIALQLHKDSLNTIAKNNLKIKRISNTCYTCLRDLDELNLAIHKQKMTLNAKSLPIKKEVVCSEQTSTNPILEKEVIHLPKKSSTITPPTPQKSEKRPVNNNNSAICVSSYSIFEEQKIKTDPRINHINALLGLMGTLTALEELEEYDYLKNNHTLCQFAAHYLLVKCSHLIANSASKDFGFKTLVIPGSMSLYHLRNNLVHYPRLCLHEIDVLGFLKHYHSLFKEPFLALKEHGKGLTLSIKTLVGLSKFCFYDHKKEGFINSNNTLTVCRKNLDQLCAKAIELHQLSMELEKEGAYLDCELLHCAIKSLLLHGRETMKMIKKCDMKTYKLLLEFLPNFIELGNSIAHHFIKEENTSNQQYTLISPTTLFECLECVFKNQEKVNKVLDTMENEASELTLKLKAKW